jgi:hypothetical protein
VVVLEYVGGDGEVVDGGEFAEFEDLFDLFG